MGDSLDDGLDSACHNGIGDTDPCEYARSTCGRAEQIRKGGMTPLVLALRNQNP
jgi:hypothetical protein